MSTSSETQCRQQGWHKHSILLASSGIFLSRLTLCSVLSKSLCSRALQTSTAPLTALQGSGTSPQHSGQAAHSEQGTEVCSIPLFCILSICWQPACIAHEPQPQGLQCVGLWGLSTTAQGRGGDAGSDDADGSFGGSQSKQLMRSSLADQSGSYSLST